MLYHCAALPSILPHHFIHQSLYNLLSSAPTMKIQPSPEREKYELSKDEALAPLIIFEKPACEDPADGTVMKNPLAATAARLAKRRLQEQLTSEAESATTPSQASLRPELPKLPSDPTPDKILEWLSPSEQMSLSSSPEISKGSLSPSQGEPHECTAAKPRMARTPPLKPRFSNGGDNQATVEHIEYITEDSLVTVKKSRLQILEANMRRSDLLIQLSELEKERLKISNSET